MQPSVSRLTLEVDVANANALNCRNLLIEANNHKHLLRTELAKAQDLLRRTNDIVGPGRGQLRPRNNNMDRCLDDLQKDITQYFLEPK